MTGLPTDRSYAQECDAADPLAPFRQRFVQPAGPPLIYLDGNSLGMLPLATAERITNVMYREWGTGLIRSWDHWVDLPAGPATCSASICSGRPWVRWWCPTPPP